MSTYNRPGDIRRQYVASIRRRDTTAFVEDLAQANNVMLERLKKIGRAENEQVHVIDLSRDLR